MDYQISDWQAHAYQELGSILAGVMEYESPDELAMRLNRAAQDLRQYFIVDPLLGKEGEALANQMLEAAAVQMLEETKEFQALLSARLNLSE